jgi:hypothetical protein
MSIKNQPGLLPQWITYSFKLLLSPVKGVFSSSAQTDTSRCNRIKPILMEALQMLKYGPFHIFNLLDKY